MSKPYIHAKSSARRFKGKPDDYEPIHTIMDSSKGAFPSSVHRCLTHTSWFIFTILERIKFHNSCPCTADNRFPTIINSDGLEVSVRDIAEQHILEDFKNRFIPTVADYLNNMETLPWMSNAMGNSVPPSFEKIYNKKKKPESAAPMIIDGSRKPMPDVFYDGSKPIITPIDITKNLRD